MGRLSAPDFLCKDVAQGNNAVFKKTDGRVYEASELDNSRYAITKYVRRSVSFSNQNITKESDLNLTSTRRAGGDANWIFYRLSDMLLIKAEAEIQKGEAGYPTAFMLINTVNKRANDITSATRSDTLKMADYTSSKASMEELLLEERQSPSSARSSSRETTLPRA